MGKNGKNGFDKNELLIDLEDYVEGLDLDTVLVGDQDIEKISSILGQSQNSNIIYVGKTGLGKTATIHGIAQRKKDTIDGTLPEGAKRLPLHMIDRRFLLLDTNTLFEENDPDKIQQSIKRIFAELEKPGDHVLIIEDANDWLRGIEDNQCQGLISTFVRELKKGAFQSILMVRDEPGKNNLGAVMGAHSEMTEQFTILEKKPPSKENVLEIMRKSKETLERHHDGLHITDAANDEIVNLTFLYPNLRIYMREQPARALRMRDQIASIFVTRMQSRPKELDALESELSRLKHDESREAIARKAELNAKIDGINEVWEERARALGSAYREKRKYEKDLVELEDEHTKEIDALKEKLHNEKGREPTDAEMNGMKSNEIKHIEGFIRATRKAVEEANQKAAALKGEHNDRLTLDVSEVREYFSELSGIPTKDLNANEATKALDIDKRLKDKVYGQDDTIDTIAGAIKRAKAGLKNPNQPIGSFMLLGSSGLGKSYIGECLAEDLYDDKDSLTVFDMSEFMEKHTVSRLIGAPPGYAGYGEGGALTNAVRRRPYQVVMLDEIEKAHPDVFKILLQVLDKGRLSDELGTVDFRNTVFIMTTNLGQHMSFDAHRNSANSESEIKGEARKIFPQELINRVDSFLLLKAHTPDNIARILRRDLSALNKMMAGKGIDVSLSDADITSLVDDKYKVEEGARQIQKFVAGKMTNKIADVVLENSSNKDGGTITAHYHADKDDFTLDFKPKEKAPETPVADIEKTAAVPGGAPGAAAMAGIPHITWQRPALSAVFAPVMN